jgi:hypothetical protein
MPQRRHGPLTSYKMAVLEAKKLNWMLSYDCFEEFNVEIR